MNSLILSDAKHIPLSDGVVQSCITSPPYYSLRDYGADGQIGLEDTLGAYIDSLVVVFREVRRVLRDDGVLWLNLGDSYAGSGGPGGDYKRMYGSDEAEKLYMKGRNPSNKQAGFKPKDLMMVPARVAIALQEDGWYLRGEIVWWKPNSKPEGSTADRPHRDHEMIYLLSKSRYYCYYPDEVRVPYAKPMNRWGGEVLKADGVSSWDEATGQETYRRRNMRPNPKGRNLRTVWKINTSYYKGAHFATFPPELPELCIKASSQEGDIVLDPFSGSGTTVMVANNLRRHGVGLDISPEYISLARERTGETAMYEWENGKDTQANLDGLPLFNV